MSQGPKDGGGIGGGVWSFFECPSCWTSFDLRQVDARKSAICPTCLRACDAKRHQPADPDGYGSRADEEAKANTQHALDLARVEIDGLQGQVERLTRDRDEARAKRSASDRVLASGVVVSTEKYADLVRLAGGDVSLLNELHAANDRASAAEARAEALATALRKAMPTTHEGIDVLQSGPCTDACRPAKHPGDCGGHRPDIDTDRCDRSHCRRCAALLALATTPPADLTQHPAYRAARQAGIEEAALALAHRANKRDAETRWVSGRVAETRRGYDDELRCAREDIRALLDTKEVRDGT